MKWYCYDVNWRQTSKVKPPQFHKFALHIFLISITFISRPTWNQPYIWHELNIIILGRLFINSFHENSNVSIKWLERKLMWDNIYHESLSSFVMHKCEPKLKKMSVKETYSLQKKRERFWKLLSNFYRKCNNPKKMFYEVLPLTEYRLNIT